MELNNNNNLKRDDKKKIDNKNSIQYNFKNNIEMQNSEIKKKNKWILDFTLKTNLFKL